MKILSAFILFITLTSELMAEAKIVQVKFAPTVAIVMKTSSATLIADITKAELLLGQFLSKNKLAPAGKLYIKSKEKTNPAASSWMAEIGYPLKSELKTAPSEFVKGVITAGSYINVQYSGKKPVQEVLVNARKYSTLWSQKNGKEALDLDFSYINFPIDKETGLDFYQAVKDSFIDGIEISDENKTEKNTIYKEVSLTNENKKAEIKKTIISLKETLEKMTIIPSSSPYIRKITNRFTEQSEALYEIGFEVDQPITGLPPELKKGKIKGGQYLLAKIDPSKVDSAYFPMNSFELRAKAEGKNLDPYNSFLALISAEANYFYIEVNDFPAK